MVLSQINDKINYKEEKAVETEDKGFNATLYEIEIKDLEIIIALGDIKYKYIDDNVLYAPVYLIINGIVDSQIGLFELESENLMDMMDDDGDLDITRLAPPLLYKFVTPEYLKKQLSKASKHENTDDESDEEVEIEDSDEDEDEDEEDDEGEEEDGGGEEKEEKKEEGDENDEGGENDEGDEGFNLGDDDDDFGNVETRIANNLEQKKFRNPTNWVQAFFKRKEYDIVDSLYEDIGTKVAGDCLFSVIEDALNSIGKKMSVKEMREKLSKNLTSDIFDHYKNFYDMFSKQLENDKETLTSLKNIHDNLRIQAGKVKTTNRTQYREFVKQAKEIEAKFRQAKQDKVVTEQYLTEFDFMKDINTLNDMKRLIKTCDFWAETWAISTLEKILNIKMIILSSENFEKRDYDNVLLCGQINDDKEIAGDEFKPKYYIIVDHTGAHYKLITWKGKKILRFEDISYGIRELIIRKCMERNAGKFYLIPKFKKYKQTEGADIEDDKSLYNSKTILQFYSKSKDVFPGKGSGEILDENSKEEFLELSRVPEWRKKLSNFSEAPFTLDNHKWNGVEWYYQGSKFKKNNPEFYILFSLDSGSTISKDPAQAKAAGGKTGIFSKKIKGGDGKQKIEKIILRKPEIKIDDDFFGPKGRKKEEMNNAWRAKFTQNPEAKDILLKTKDAKLQHFIRGKKPEVWIGLMRIRKELKDK